MKILIVEDEQPAAKQLAKLIRKARPQAQFLPALDSIESVVDFFNSPPSLPDLIFMDIQLADGLSFTIFDQIQIDIPMIFTTAFDQYALRAFKVNSIDYLLKPVDPDELVNALEKFETIYLNRPTPITPDLLSELKNALTQPQYKERFLIKIGQQLIYLRTEEIRYFFSEDSLVYAITEKNKKHLIDYSLEQLEQVLQPKFFFRINRKIILHLEAIDRIHTYFNGRLKLDMLPKQELEPIVSRDRVADFKKWLDR